VIKVASIIVVVLLSWLTCAGAGEIPAGFDANFLDRTLRVDYVRTGNATEEVITPDRIFEQGSWAGSRVNLIDRFDIGRTYAKVYDLASGTLLYSYGYDTYFGEYRTTDSAGKGIRRAYHESVLIPYPKRKIRLAIEVRGKDRRLAEIASFEIDPNSWEIAREPLDESVKVLTLARGGDPHSCVDLAILAEGYTAAQEAKVKVDFERFAKLLLSAEPYARLKDRFNIYGVWKPSQDSGCDEPSHGSFRRTPLGATFDSLGSERYVLTEANREVRDIAAHVPYDAIVIMVNAARYGGGGIYRSFCTFTTDNQWNEYIFLHELGHSFSGLADEYYTSSVAYNEFYPKGVEPNEANITALLDPAKLKWRDLVTPGTAVPTPWEKADYDAQDRAYQRIRGEVNAKIAKAKREGAPKPEVEKLQEESERLSREHQTKMDAYLAKSAFVGKVGAFEGAGYSAEGLYRPMLDCLMFSKGNKPLCRVCQSAVERVIAWYGE
jgi:hypothetical protein